MSSKFLKMYINNKYQFPLLLLMVFVSILSCIISFFVFFEVHIYSMIFLLPLSFAVLSLIFSDIYSLLFDNLGVTLIIMLMFVRSTLSPLFMALFGIDFKISTLNYENNLFATILLVYEMFFVFLTIKFTISKLSKFVHLDSEQIDNFNQKRIKSLFWTVLIGSLLLLLLCIKLVPQILYGYRSIFQIGQLNFTSYEDAYLVAKYGTNLASKFAIVTGNYLMRAMLIIVPGILVITMSRKKSYIYKFISFACCFIPLFFIGGVVARSLIYVFCLLLLFLYIYSPQFVSKRMVYIIIIIVVLILAWWVFNSDSVDFFRTLTERLNAYFSGIFNVSACYKLYGNFFDKFSYFIGDFIDAIPYSGTIFGNVEQTISELFNNANNVRGQIPPTIGISRFYFGPLFAPLYSVMFTYFSVKFSEILKIKIKSNPLCVLRLLLGSMYFAMGIIMYNIQITLTNFFTLLLPMYLLERFAYKSVKQND